MKEKKKSKELVESKKKDKKKKNKEVNSNENVDSINGGDKEEETDFWMPPIGERWDFDDGKDRWESCQSTHPKDDSGSNSGKITFMSTCVHDACVRVCAHDRSAGMVDLSLFETEH